MSDPRLEAWLRALLATPGLTAIDSFGEAWAWLVEDALRAVDVVAGFEGDVVDVGSGGGSPGIPLAAALPKRDVVLLEASRRKCDFLEAAARSFANVRVICGRAEEQPTDVYGVATAKALAAPPVAAEWCLPLVRPGGAAVLWVGPSADVTHVARVARKVGGGEPALRAGLVVVPKIEPTPAGFPRRPGTARKRPL